MPPPFTSTSKLLETVSAVYFLAHRSDLAFPTANLSKMLPDGMRSSIFFVRIELLPASNSRSDDTVNNAKGLEFSGLQFTLPSRVHPPLYSGHKLVPYKFSYSVHSL